MKPLLLIIISILIFGCQPDMKKERLVEALVEMRKIPSRLVSIEEKEHYEIAYQNKKHISERYNYPNNYSIGKLNESKSDFKYVTHIYNISPIDQFDYVKNILETYESDSTYIATIIKEENKLKANVYRKSKTNSEYKMWKWVETKTGELDFTTNEVMNEHLF